MIANRRHVSLCACSLVALLAFGTGEPAAQTFPSNTIRIVAPTGPGSPPDVISRVIATELAQSEDWRVVVENRPGALTTIAMADVLKQPADGYSIFPVTVGAMATPALLPNMGLRLDSDFAPVIKITKSHTALVVTPSLTVKSTAELVALLRNAPDKYNMSVGGFGTPSHLLGEVFRLQTGVRVAIVPYQQNQQRIADLLSGATHFSFYTTIAVGNLVAAGKLRALAVTAPRRIAALADVPAIAEQGFPNLWERGEDWVGFLGTRGTPSGVIARLNEAVNKALTRPTVREAMASLGAEPVGGSPDEFGKFIKSQLAYWDSIVKQAGI